MSQVASPIRTALQKDSTLQKKVKDGLHAIETAHKDFIDSSLRKAFTDSLALDEALQADHPQDSRWDYLLGHTGRNAVIGMEPHSAHSDQVSKVIQKQKEAQSQLRKHLQPGKRVAAWFWVSSGKVDFQPIDKATLRLAQEGITFVGKVLLPKHLEGIPTSAEPNPKPSKRTRR